MKALKLIAFLVVIGCVWVLMRVDRSGDFAKAFADLFHDVCWMVSGIFLYDALLRCFNYRLQISKIK